MEPGNRLVEQQPTETHWGITLAAKLNLSQESALIANRESQEEWNQMKLNAGETAAQILCLISKRLQAEKEFENLERVTKMALRMMFEKQVMELFCLV